MLVNRPRPFQVESMRVYRTPEPGAEPTDVREVEVTPQTSKLARISHTAPQLTQAQLDLIRGKGRG